MDVLKPPEELEYATCDMAEASIQTNAKQPGYAVARNKLYNDKKGELRRRTFRCAMGHSRWVSHLLTLSRRVPLLSKVSKKIFTITGSTSALDLAFKVWRSSRHSQHILCRLSSLPQSFAHVGDLARARKIQQSQKTSQLHADRRTGSLTMAARSTHGYQR